MLVSGKSSSSAVPDLPGIAHVRYTKAHVRRGQTFVFRVSGKPRPRAEGRGSLAISNGANAIYRHPIVAVVVVSGSCMSDEP